MKADSIEIKEQDKISFMSTDDELRSDLYGAIRMDAYDVLGLDHRPALRTVDSPANIAYTSLTSHDVVQE